MFTTLFTMLSSQTRPCCSKTLDGKSIFTLQGLDPLWYAGLVLDCHSWLIGTKTEIKVNKMLCLVLQYCRVDFKYQHGFTCLFNPHPPCRARQPHGPIYKLAYLTSARAPNLNKTVQLCPALRAVAPHSMVPVAFHILNGRRTTRTWACVVGLALRAP